jgi:hypothetical protein
MPKLTITKTIDIYSWNSSLILNFYLVLKGLRVFKLIKVISNLVKIKIEINKLSR